MKRYWAALLAGALLLGGLTGCGGSTQAAGSGDTGSAADAEEQTAEITEVEAFSLAYNTNDGMDPIFCTSAENQLLLQLCYESLFQLDGNYQPQKVMCDSFEQTGDRVYTLTIRQGLYFHSGAAVTAEDVVYSLNRARQEDGSQNAEKLANISSVKYKDDQITIRLYEADANLAALLDIPIYREGSEEDTFPDGSGAYMPVETNGTASLIPFAQWRGGAVGFCSSIELVSVNDSSGAENLLSSGDISMLLRQDAEDTVVQGTRYTETVPTTKLHYLGINCGLEPFDKENVRAALSMLLDRDTIVQTCFAGRADAAVVPLRTIPDGVELPTYNEETALALLKDAGIYDRNDDGYLDISRSTPFTIEIIYNSNYSTKGAVLAQYETTLEKAGIETTVTPLDVEECRNELRRESFWLYYGEYEVPADYNLSSLITGNGDRNFGAYYDRDMEEAVNAVCEAEADDRDDALRGYITCFTEQTPIIPIAFERAQVISAEQLPKQFDPWPDNIFHGIESWSANG